MDDTSSATDERGKECFTLFTLHFCVYVTFTLTTFVHSFCSCRFDKTHFPDFAMISGRQDIHGLYMTRAWFCQ